MGVGEDVGTRDVLAAGRPASQDVGARRLRTMLRDSLAGESTPVVVGRYRVGDRIGAGGCGVVYEGHDPQLDRAVAIKLVPIPEERDAALALREARCNDDVLPRQPAGLSS